MLHLHFLQFDAVILKSQLFLFDGKCVFPMQISHCGEVASKEIWSFCKSILKSRTRIVTEKLCGHVEIHGNALSIFVSCTLWLCLCIFVLDLSYSKRAFDIYAYRGFLSHGLSPVRLLQSYLCKLSFRGPEPRKENRCKKRANISHSALFCR